MQVKENRLKRNSSTMKSLPQRSLPLLVLLSQEEGEGEEGE